MADNPAGTVLAQLLTNVGYVIAVFSAIQIGINIGTRVKDSRDLATLNNEIFFQRSAETQHIIGLRRGNTPSPLDVVGLKRAFLNPIQAELDIRLRKESYQIPPPVDPGKNHILVGGWRPLREVESILRGRRFLFAIENPPSTVLLPREKAPAVFVPDELHMRLIRIKPHVRLQWVVFDTQEDRILVHKNEQLRPTRDVTRGTWLRDQAIITRHTASNGKVEVGFSGCHGEGTCAATSLTSDVRLMEEVLHELAKKGLQGKDFQMVIDYKFRPHSEDSVPVIIGKGEMEIAGVSD